MDDIKKFESLFFQSVKQHLEGISDNLKGLSATDNNQHFIEELHRHFHSLKSECFVMGYSQVGAFLTIFEKFLKKHKEDKTTIPSDKAQILSQGITELRVIVEELEHTKQEPKNTYEKAQSYKERLEVVIE